MIVAETRDGYRFVTQPEHGTQVGAFARAWGGGDFEPPTPFAPVVMAASHHDAGWYDYDLTPHVVDGTPASVLDTTREEWTTFYDHGIETVAERDAYAGLLCAMHGAGVRRRRYGTQSDLPDYTTEFSAFIEAQEDRQRALADSLVEGDSPLDETDRRALGSLQNGTLPDVESGLYRNYRLLQTWDRLSLYCCTTVENRETTIGPAPVAPGTPDTDLTLTPDGDVIHVDPFPFEGESLTTAVRAREIPVTAFEQGDEQSLVRAYYDAPVTTLDFRFVP